ncbi:mesoderm induction early response protein 1-like isoform X2 [Pimephales promelas]|uniref:mesoderm induction early response protein 1-like isoform X2 n=1 Tax=Pimephales promelas TaxID=90988 RepID=UPI0019555DC2|nr:mesoderm induction early response protein 1-like isoform X2 [Pimephales promelas]
MAEPSLGSSSPEMLLPDYDDDQTPEDEELPEGDTNFGNEIEELAKEGEMPIQELLSLYGYAGSGSPEEEDEEYEEEDADGDEEDDDDDEGEDMDNDESSRSTGELKKSKLQDAMANFQFHMRQFVCRLAEEMLSYSAVADVMSDFTW